MTSVPDVKESRIFMTFDGSASGVSTIAHELGHAFHSSILKDMPVLRQNYAMNVAETASTFAELIVADDGKGLPESDLERVLRPFERGDTARGNASGTGLGLSIVNRVAKAGGGSVRLAQNIPNGLSVQMTIPVGPKASVVRKLTEGKEPPEKAD